jgi:hypothetical protein
VPPRRHVRRRRRPCTMNLRRLGRRWGVPWIKLGRGGHAYPFYYHGVLADARVNQSAGAVIYTGGGTTAFSTKVLWMTGGSTRRGLLTGTRLDAPGKFAQQLRGVGGFASIVRVPAAGCWKLTLRAGRRHATVTLEAVDPRLSFSCDATPVRRDVPDPIGTDIPWLTATPASSGITGTIFYHFPANITRAVIYPNKQTPDNATRRSFGRCRRRQQGDGSSCWRHDSMHRRRWGRSDSRRQPTAGPACHSRRD